MKRSLPVALPYQDMRWKSDLEKMVITKNLRELGLSEATDGEDWNVYWALPLTVRQIFHPESGYRLNDHQIVNHFPNSYELTRKDCLVKNIKRYRKDMEKIGFAVPDIVPVTYQLPADFRIFTEEFHRHPSWTWIVKPSGRAQGRGIYIVTKFSQVAAQFQAKSEGKEESASKEVYVVSRYIDKPLLIGGRKFDLRIYVLVTSYRPLRVYLYREAFARFCVVRYSSSANDLGNLFMHLTNVAVQKHSSAYNKQHGGKWTIKNMRLFLEAQRGKEATDKLFKSIEDIILHSLKAVQNVITNDKHCFELYGYDLLIDSDLKPWLVEVNASPSLSTTTEKDQRMKYALIRDVFKVVIPKRDANHNVGTEKGKGGESFDTTAVAAGAGGGGAANSGAGLKSPSSGAKVSSGFQAQLEVLVSNRWSGGVAMCTDNIVGGFELLYDETIDIALGKIRTVEGRKATGPARWR